MRVPEDLINRNGKKILLIVLDGLGGLPVQEGKTELELAKTPNLDRLAKESALGMHVPVDTGITPGSGPGHLGLFGYDPKKYEIGRGILEALGLGIEVRNTDLCARGNYATAKYENGTPIITDRRAGRIPTELNRKLSSILQKEIREINGVEVIIKPGMEHRFAVVFRFPEPLKEGSSLINDTDPQKEGRPPLSPRGETESANRVAEIVKEFIERASSVLKERDRANHILLRGFAQKPDIPTMEERFGLRACCIAVYPMYKGLASLVGMDMAEPEESTLEGEISALQKKWDDYDFFFLHIKKTDSYGEDGNYEGKIKVIEEFDRHLPQILALNPDVIAITGDHSTPSVLKGHSWHPVPLLIHSPYVLGKTSERLTERECLKGEIGIIPAEKILNLLLAHSLRLNKYGA